MMLQQDTPMNCIGAHIRKSIIIDINFIIYSKKKWSNPLRRGGATFGFEVSTQGTILERDKTSS